MKNISRIFFVILTSVLAACSANNKQDTEKPYNQETTNSSKIYYMFCVSDDLFKLADITIHYLDEAMLYKQVEMAKNPWTFTLEVDSIANYGYYVTMHPKQNFKELVKVDSIYRMELYGTVTRNENSQKHAELDRENLPVKGNKVGAYIERWNEGKAFKRYLGYKIVK